MNRFKYLLASLAVALGLMLIVGATSNLPPSAQGIVTGQNEMLIEQLADHVGEAQLTQALIKSGAFADDLNPAVNGVFGNDDDIEDQLEAMDPAQVYQIAVDAGLIDQAMADAALEQ